jgi:hypothetical protein
VRNRQAAGKQGGEEEEEEDSAQAGERDVKKGALRASSRFSPYYIFDLGVR